MSANQIISRSLQLSLKRCSVPVSFIQSRSCSNKTLMTLETLTRPQKKEMSKDNLITVEGPATIAPISGIPEEHIKGRLVRIYKTPKNAMQSGTNNADIWELEFETKTRWENPLMGWTSTGDPHSNLKVQFNDFNSAVSYAEKNGWQWFMEPEKKVKPKVKSYGFNFSWNKRNRVSTK